MGDVYFYHLTRRSVADALGPLLDRSLRQGWRVAVRGTDADRLDLLDEALWLGPKDGFLPHGRAGGPHDARQPILLTTEAAAPNAPHCVVAVDGAALEADEVRGLERAAVVFEAADDMAMRWARGRWKTLTEAGVGARYWSEESGRWQEKMTRNV